MTLTTNAALTASAPSNDTKFGIPNIAKRIDAPEPLTKLALEAGLIPGKMVSGVWTAEEPDLAVAHAAVARDADRLPRHTPGGPHGFRSQASFV